MVPWPMDLDLERVIRQVVAEASNHNPFTQDRHLNRRDTSKQNRAAALAEWCEPMA